VGEHIGALFCLREAKDLDDENFRHAEFFAGFGALTPRNKILVDDRLGHVELKFVSL
jgi:hypothetical protein